MNDRIIKELKKEVKIPDIVNESAQEALEQIRQMAAQSGANPPRKTKNKRYWRAVSKAAVWALAGVAAVGAVAAGAVSYHKWSSGLQDKMQVSESDEVKLEQTGLADFPEQSVTVDGVTVTAQQSIVDNYFAYVSFKVEGYAVEDGLQPEFDAINVTLDGESVSSVCGFYDNTIMGADGRAVLTDGSPIPQDADGSLQISYAQADGSLEYHMMLYPDYGKGTFMGKQIHVDLSGLGVYLGKCEDIRVDVDGPWTFDWALQGDNNTTKIATEKTLGDTDAKVTSVEISPISVKAVIETDTDTFTTQTGEVSDSFPWLLGVKYKDGTLDAYCLSGGQNERDGNFITQLSATQRIMDVDEIEGLLFKKRDVLEGQTVTEDDVYVVPIR